MEPTKEFALKVLRNLGLDASEIPVCDEKRADLKATDGEVTYLIEVKEKLDNPDGARYETWKSGQTEIRVRVDSHSRTSSIANKLNEARQQLDSTPSLPDTFRVIWMHVHGTHVRSRARQALCTFYGLVHLIPHSGKQVPMHCFYFDYNTAFDMPTVHGLMLIENDEPLLCLNEFAHNESNFRHSSLVQEFSQHGAVYDPIERVKSGQAIALRSNVPRKDEAVVLEELHRETNDHYSVLRMNQYSY